MCFLPKVLIVILLLSLTAAAPTPDDCVHLSTIHSAMDLHTIFGKWILHEAYALSSDDFFSHILKTTNSSQIEFIRSDNNHTVVFKQARMRNEACTRYSVNFTVVGHKIQHMSTTYNSTAEAEFLKTCGDCLLMRYSTVIREGRGNTYLLFYKKTETLPKEDQERTRQQAKCLGFLEPPEFIYTQAELCAEKSDATKAKEPEQ